MAVSKDPWEIHADLTRERLHMVAKTMYDARVGALDRYKPTKGETSWSHGCVAHEWCKAALTRLQNETDFIRTECQKGRFTFHIGAVPFRFYKADPKRPGAKTRESPPSEQYELAGMFPADEGGRVFRVFVVLGEQLDPHSIIFLQLDHEGAAHNLYSLSAESLKSTLLERSDDSIELPENDVDIERDIDDLDDEDEEVSGA